MKESIVLFDGVCNLCNASVQFIIKRDKKKRFKFASLQSDFAQQLFKKQQFDSQGIDSVVLFENDKLHVRSTAALKIARKLDRMWFLFYSFVIIPAPLRDVVYDFIARNRYKWFGKKEFCAMPEPGMKERFLE
ncbi:MAG: DCC1-like thiol-disulfide oxidoreductase family protein [Chitinophagales bacterium]|nr:DCC1-like thiol-disulfide oxidoreductase family protein [Chitinophagales bacterium]